MWYQPGQKALTLPRKECRGKLSTPNRAIVYNVGPNVNALFWISPSFSWVARLYRAYEAARFVSDNPVAIPALRALLCARPPFQNL